MSFNITKANENDAKRLTEIAWQSKSYWKYPVEWMELWRAGLTITPEMIEQNEVFKLVSTNRQIIGCCVLITEKDVLWVEHLWVLPDNIGQGFGEKLLQTALNKTVQSRHQKIKVISDINAEAFYKKMGFQTVGQYESVPKGRFLPLMECGI